MSKTLGMKFDSDKSSMGLLPPYALESVSDVLTFGAKKYLPNNWKYVDNGPQRYLDAALRHITAYMKGEENDPETNLPHLSHALCCLMFIVDLSLEAKAKAKKESRDPFQQVEYILNDIIRSKQVAKDNFASNKPPLEYDFGPLTNCIGFTTPLNPQILNETTE